MVEDWPARVIGAAGVFIGLSSLALTLYLWLRSGPELKVKTFVRAETGMVHVEVANTGRLTATVKRLELRDHTVLKVRGGDGGRTVEFSRWSISVPLNTENTPVDLAATAYVEAEYAVQAVLETAAGAPTVTIAAWVQRGDGKWYSSVPVRLR